MHLQVLSLQSFIVYSTPDFTLRPSLSALR